MCLITSTTGGLYEAPTCIPFIISTTTTIPYAMMAISLFVSVCSVILLCLMCVATCIACSLTKDHDVYVHLLSNACAAMGVGNEMAEADTWE